MSQRSEFRFTQRLRVRWAEVDAQQVVFNGHYQMYCSTAISGYWRALGLPYAQMLTYFDADMSTRKVTLEYLASARYDDTLDVGVRCLRIGNSSVTFDCTVFRGDRVLVSTEFVWVWIDRTTRRSTTIPQQMREALESFEAGQPMVSVRVGRWDELGPDAQVVRKEVFIDEQEIPAEMEWDGADPGCVHAVAYNRLGMPLATGRLLEHVPGVAKIGRMAVLASMRGASFGEQVLDALMQAARQRGEREVLLHAQLSAAGFYRRAGFTARGPVFDEAGIAHIEMVRAL